MKNWWKHLNTPKWTPLGALGWVAYTVFVFSEIYYEKIIGLVVLVIVSFLVVVIRPTIEDIEKRKQS